MCWETKVIFACGCTVVVDIRLCEHSVFPWTHNVAHPKGKRMKPTVRVEPSPEYCKYCTKEKGKRVVAPESGGSGVGRGESKAKGESEKKGKGKEAEVEGVEQESRDEKKRQHVKEMLKLYNSKKGASFVGAAGGSSVPAAPAKSISPGLETVEADENEVEDEVDEDENEDEDGDEGDYDDYDNYDDEEDAAAHEEVEAPMVDELTE